MDPIKLLEQDNDTVAKTNKILVKVIHLLLCGFLSIWICEKFGYRLMTVSFDLQTLIRIFSEYYLLLGITVLLIVINSIRFISLHLSSWIAHLMLWLFPKKGIKYRGYNAEDFLKYLTAIKSIEANPKKEHQSLYKKINETIENDKIGIENLVHLFVSFSFSYGFIVSEKFPNIFSGWISALLWFITTVMLFIFGVVQYMQKTAEKAFSRVKSLPSLPTSASQDDQNVSA